MLQNLINYTSLADRTMIDTFLEAGKPMPDAEYLFSHILNAQHIWMKRVLHEEIEYERFQVHSVGEFEKIHLTNIDHILQVFHTRDPEEQIIYENSAGDKFDNKISDILFHVVNHSTYHRGQVVTQFRLNGIIPPPSTDYIMFKRDGLL